VTRVLDVDGAVTVSTRVALPVLNDSGNARPFGFGFGLGFGAVVLCTTGTVDGVLTGCVTECGLGFGAVVRAGAAEVVAGWLVARVLGVPDGVAEALLRLGVVTGTVGVLGASTMIGSAARLVGALVATGVLAGRVASAVLGARLPLLTPMATIAPTPRASTASADEAVLVPFDM